MPATTSTVSGSVAADDRSASAPCCLDHLCHRAPPRTVCSMASASTCNGLGRRGWRAVHCTTSISDQVLVRNRSPAQVRHSRRAARRAVPARRSRARRAGRGRGHVAAVELLQAGAQLGAGGEAEPQAVAFAARRGPQHQASASPVMWLRDQRREAAEAAAGEDDRGVVARQLAQRNAVQLDRPGRASQRARHAGGVEAPPVVSGLPVVRSSAGAPSDSSQSRSPSRRSNTSVEAPRRRPGIRGGSPRSGDAARSRRSRAASSRRLGRAFSSSRTDAPRERRLGGRHQPGHAGARDHDIPVRCIRVSSTRASVRGETPTFALSIPARSSPCARRTRS